MSQLRHLFTARSARPKVEASMRAIVRSAIYLASADGEVKEAEIESLIDGLRAVMGNLVGHEQLDEYAKVPTLLDEARIAIRELAAHGETAFLKDISSVLDGDLRKEAVTVARDVTRADAVITDSEKRALEKLAAAVNVSLEA